MIMEYQKIINLLDNTQNEPSKFRTRNCFEINGESRRMYNKSNQIKFNEINFKTMIRSHLCGYSDAYILVSGSVTITGSGDEDAAKRADERIKGVIFKGCA